MSDFSERKKNFIFQINHFPIAKINLLTLCLVGLSDSSHFSLLNGIPFAILGKFNERKIIFVI